MKKYFLVYFSVIAAMLFLPLIIVKISTAGVPAAPQKMREEKNFTVTAYIKNEDRVMEMDLEEYICGVVSAEMPASFPLEALKAQAVAARSYVMNKIEKNLDLPEHHGAQVCTDSAHCKAWMSREERMGKWAAEEAEGNMRKIERAVYDTKGEIITYGGEPAVAVFYAISSGKTENSKEVWGGDVPYLQSVESPHDVNAPGYSSQEVMTLEEFKNKFKAAHPEADFEGKWYSGEIRSQGGAVAQAEIGGVKVKGTEIRTIYGLRSHNFTLKLGEKAVFDVVGYGHGVGMSQWGAKFYAEEGKSYRDILRIYYSGVEIEEL